MSFTETPAAAFTAGVSVISAATANTWKANIADGLDTVNGGAYTNVSTIDWLAGSAGWRFYAAVAIKSTGTLTLDAGATVTINADPSLFGTMRVGVGSAGGGVRFYATSTLQVDDTVACSIAGDVTWTGASTQVHASSSTETHATGSSDVYSSGSTFTIQSGTIANLNLGGASAAGVTFIGANGAAVWNGASTATWQTASISSWESGSNFTVTSGAIANATFGGGGTAGTLAVGADGTFTVTAGAAVTMSVGGGGTPGTLTINADGTLTTSASADFNNGGTTTRTGVEILSGNGAYTARRVAALTVGDINLDARTVDFAYTTGSVTNYTCTLTDLGASDYVVFYLKHRANGGSTYTISANGGTLYVMNPTGTMSQTIQLVWDGADWTLGLVGAAV